MVFFFDLTPIQIRPRGWKPIRNIPPRSPPPQDERLWTGFVSIFYRIGSFHNFTPPVVSAFGAIMLLLELFYVIPPPPPRVGRRPFRVRAFHSPSPIFGPGCPFVRCPSFRWAQSGLPILDFKLSNPPLRHRFFSFLSFLNTSPLCVFFLPVRTRGVRFFFPARAVGRRISPFLPTPYRPVSPCLPISKTFFQFLYTSMVTVLSFGF